MVRSFLRVSSAGILSLILAAAIMGCGSNKTDPVNVNLGNLDIHFILSPGDSVTLEGSTLVVQGYSGSPIVHSYPSFAGVPDLGDIGIGTAVGYVPGESFTVPFNANLGTQVLNSYTVCVSINPADSLQLKSIAGSNSILAANYPGQYHRAQGFEGIPNDTYPAPGTVCVSAVAASGLTATGTVNLAELEFTVLSVGLPSTGTNLNFSITGLRDSGGNDLCANFTSGDCNLLDGLVIKKFRIIR